MKIKIRNGGNVFSQRAATRKRLAELARLGMTAERLRESGADETIVSAFIRLQRNATPAV